SLQEAADWIAKTPTSAQPLRGKATDQFPCAEVLGPHLRNETRLLQSLGGTRGNQLACLPPLSSSRCSPVYIQSPVWVQLSIRRQSTDRARYGHRRWSRLSFP